MAAALDASSAAAIRAEAIRAARARRRAPAEDLSIAAAKRTLAGPASPATWRPRRLAERLDIDVGARRVTLRLDGAARDFVDASARVDGSEGLAACPTEPAVAGLVDDWPGVAGDWSLAGLAARQRRRPRRKRRGGDDAPLYVFDAAERAALAGLGPPPPCLADDALPRLLGCADEAKRPLPRGWLLAGAERSGTPVHDHPLTCAYVVLLSGCKLWAVLPPGTDRSSLFPSSGGDYDLSAADWFLRWDRGPPPGAKIFVQQPREVVFVPAGWWHVVLNASDNVALSRSLALDRDFAFLDAGPATALERDRAEALRAARNGGDNCV
ncbi:hypothetical protein JL721_9619 [Aureococcus anophagefferens]|nr:hypothetical protein JL721_9619 [Aureococcus anophagefferens]